MTAGYIWPFGDDISVEHLADSCRRLVEGFAIFNPHATISLNLVRQNRDMDGH